MRIRWVSFCPTWRGRYPLGDDWRGYPRTMNAPDWLPRYDRVRQRVASLLEVQTAIVDTRVPACPDWTGIDVLRHLVGLADDLVHSRVDGWASPAWTATHVSSLSASPVSELLARWEASSALLHSVGPLLGLPAASFAFGDAVVHEADLGGAASPQQRVPDDDVEIAIRTGIQRWRPVLAAAGAPPLAICVPGLRTWALGDGPVVTTLAVPEYELFRFLYGRRSAEQVAGLGWSSAADGYLEAGLPYPFKWSDADLVD